MHWLTYVNFSIANIMHICCIIFWSYNLFIVSAVTSGRRLSALLSHLGLFLVRHRLRNAHVLVTLHLGLHVLVQAVRLPARDVLHGKVSVHLLLASARPCGPRTD